MYTTKLLAIIDDRMPRRHQAITAAIVVFLALGSIAGSRPAERTVVVVQPPVVIIATPTVRPAGAVGLMKEAAPMGAPALSAPTATPQPTDAPALVEPIAVAVPTAAPAVAPAAEPTAPPRWTIR